MKREVRVGRSEKRDLNDWKRMERKRRGGGGEGKAGKRGSERNGERRDAKVVRGKKWEM